MKKMTTTILILTTLSIALIAGLFYGYSCSVNIGLGQLPDREYLAAMQSINAAILNPLFFLSFMGTLLLLPTSCYLNYQQPAFMLLLLATIVYAIGVFGVTIFGNVPLNDALADFNLNGATVTEVARQRVKFEKPWNTLHTIRTLASVLSLVLVILACIKMKSDATLLGSCAT